MILSAVFLAAIGMGLTFFPQEINAFLGLGLNVYLQLMLQIMGALYFGFAMINWMAKRSIIGGIYNRPLVIGNFAHFFISAIALVKLLSANNSQMPYAVWLFTIIYVIFAVIFGILFNRHPKTA